MTGISEILDDLREAHMLRTIPIPLEESVIDLSSNDYLGLGSRHMEFREEFADRFPDAAFSSSASRLLSSRQKYHLAFENLLSRLYGKEALLFNSGYHANVGCIGALTLPPTLFVCDKLIHASVIDGLKINSSDYKRFPHNDISKLRRILETESLRYERLIVVVESIYSMDGDEAPLKEIVSLKKEFPNVFLYIDEAHAFGVRGARGLGLCEEAGLIQATDILIGTLGKAAASVGAFAIVSGEIKSLLVNKARPFIFSTALPPVNIAWSLLMTEKITTMDKERRQLRALENLFSGLLSDISGKETKPSHILPLLTGNAEQALRIAASLKEAGVLALPIRRPTVPPGGERIRFSLSAALSPGQITYAAKKLREII